MSTSIDGEKSTRIHWESVWHAAPRMRLPSGLNIGIRNLQGLLKCYVRPGMRFIELGCAPGKMLAWVAVRLKAEVAGLDYSPNGMTWARQLFQALGLAADLRCEDVFATTFPAAHFDVVYSAGLIEHFDDPTDIVQCHLRLVRPGGVALMSVPNFGGLYGWLQEHFDPERLGIHNLRIMNPAALRELAPRGPTWATRSFATGRLSPWIVNFGCRWRPAATKAAEWGLNTLGLLQPFDVTPLCPLLVLEVRSQDTKGHAVAC